MVTHSQLTCQCKSVDILPRVAWLGRSLGFVGANCECFMDGKTHKFYGVGVHRIPKQRRKR